MSFCAIIEGNEELNFKGAVFRLIDISCFPSKLVSAVVLSSI